MISNAALVVVAEAHVAIVQEVTLSVIKISVRISDQTPLQRCNLNGPRSPESLVDQVVSALTMNCPQT